MDNVDIFQARQRRIIFNLSPENKEMRNALREDLEEYWKEVRNTEDNHYNRLVIS